MILWNDGFSAYTTTTSLGSIYTLGGTPLLQQPGRLAQSSRDLDRSIQLAPTASIRTANLQSAASSGGDVLVMGFAVKITNQSLANDNPCITVFIDNSVQTNIYCRHNTITGGYHFEVVLMNSTATAPLTVLLRSPEYTYAVWHYIEFKIVYSSSGSVEWRSDGITVAKVTGIRTENQFISPRWNNIRITGSAFQFRITDLYICNGASASTSPRYSTFLGPSQSRRVRPTLRKTGSIQQWTTHHNNGPLIGSQEVDLHVLSGQSNAEGTGNSPTPVGGGIASPNNSMLIWDRRTTFPTAQFMPLLAGGNNNGHFNIGPASAFYGPEMTLCDALLDYHAAEADSVFAPFGHAFVKGAQSSASLFPSVMDFCFYPLLPGNLYNDFNGVANPLRGNLKADMQNAIAAIGGTSRIRRIHFYWHQGETDGFFDYTARDYAINLELLLNTIVADFTPIPVTFHIVRIHKDLKLASAPNALDGFWFRDTIRAQQEIVVAKRKDCRLISIDHLPQAWDQVHYTNFGTEAEGRLLFRSWLDSQNLAEEIDELDMHDGNTTFAGAKNTNRATLVKADSPRTLRGAEILTNRTALVAASSSAGDYMALASKQGTQAVEGESFISNPSFAPISVQSTRDPSTNKPFTPDTIESGERGFITKASPGVTPL